MSFWSRNGKGNGQTRATVPVTRSAVSRLSGRGSSIPRDIEDGLRRLDLMVVMDVTGSMQPSINECKRKVRELFDRISMLEPIRPDLAVGVLGYRDHCDRSVVPHVVPLSTDIEAVRRGLEAFRANGGGDAPEAVLFGLNKAIRETSWRQHSFRVLVLVGDAPPHGFGAPDDSYPRGCPHGTDLGTITSSAKECSVLMGHTVGVGNCAYMRKAFQEIATGLAGEYVPLSAIDALIARIESLLRGAVMKMTEDATVLEEIYRDPTMSSEALATKLNKTLPEIAASVKRLETRKTLTR